ncbi:hypothetical protein P170DRAFT_441180 [Aspergillus steynii IBT 23096]|uniref:Uncharacterized protein n=1 Tax=Aspergillus steynii IBT 23096 TaxID=1392250 RepID=A0A2I2FSX3_9EURO|nr:uncharacterized protein P170DRAFT_441180 [Aspergillus steynii IBT 23096]PLB43724.1 hypothetical protein P170DRAFT_441180 [Aspergillus steynii IBT 23096]
MADNTVSIDGIDKVELTYALWQNSEVAFFFAQNNVRPPTLTKDELREIGPRNQWSFDYLKGRLIKCDLSGTVVNPEGYDRDYGLGAFRAVVDSLRTAEKPAEKPDEKECSPSAQAS